ncbi:hypothetical protein [uncultured Sulfitobacter sp.]|uniref:hypothetical protein n=1 Tax=uncultured Sulfitobacter sp. TaxID=191468 RepID=UPI00262770DE|nr:hypothetical protein [uncultured Sulfitobacter sp.]
MTDKSTDELIELALDGLIGQPVKNALAPAFSGDSLPRLDTSKPNFHDNKREFQLEKDVVAAVIHHLEGIIDQFVYENDDHERSKMRDRLETAVDEAAIVASRRTNVQTPRDLAVRNVAETGFFLSSMFVIINTMECYKIRLRDLEDQEKQFWSVPHRPPNYYARTIALRLARLYAKTHQAKPTFGIARDGNHPSTEFGRALEQIFAALEIKASVRGAAEWAIGQLTEDEINPPQRGLLGALLGSPGDPPLPKKSSNNATCDIVEALLKGQST